MYVQVLDCKYITFKWAVNISECIDIDEYIYKGVVEPYYKKILEQMPIMVVTSGYIEEKSPRKRYVDHPKGRSKPSYLINGPEHSLDQCKVTGKFGSNYTKSRHTTDRGYDPPNGKKFNRQ